MKGDPRTTFRGAVGVFAVIAALQVFDLVTRNDVLTALVTIVICGTYIGWWIWSNRYQ
jgi:hypothetical protein